ncbi:MAG: hypothetical protein HYX61_00065 [Gammaproteobacteria bacterium]|nr:hypothetical protein [Gammaproteobacteria bacterium]
MVLKQSPDDIRSLLNDISLFLSTQRVLGIDNFNRPKYVTPHIQELNLLYFEVSRLHANKQEIDPALIQQLNEKYAAAASLAKLGNSSRPKQISHQFKIDSELKSEALLDGVLKLDEIHAQYAQKVIAEPPDKLQYEIKKNVIHIADKDLAITIGLYNQPKGNMKASKVDLGFNPKDVMSYTVDASNLDRIRVIPQFQQSPASPYQTQHFEQGAIIPKVQSKGKELKRLNSAINNYNGLCEIICNHIVMNDILSPARGTPRQAFDALNQTMVMKKLEEEVAPLHILKQVSVFQLLKASLFNKIPYNHLSTKEQKGLNNLNEKLQNNPEKVNELMSKAIDNIQVGTYAKFFAFKKEGLNFQGHSMLIRKNENGSFIFFDPNHGAKTFATKKELQTRLIEAFKECHREFKSENICFMDVQKMLPKPEQKLSERARI